jgi:hypothetical protein
VSGENKLVGRLVSRCLIGIHLKCRGWNSNSARIEGAPTLPPPNSARRYPLRAFSLAPSLHAFHHDLIAVSDLDTHIGFGNLHGRVRGTNQAELVQSCRAVRAFPCFTSSSWVAGVEALRNSGFQMESLSTGASKTLPRPPKIKLGKALAGPFNSPVSSIRTG